MTKRWANKSEYDAEIQRDVEDAIKECVTIQDINDNEWMYNDSLQDALTYATDSANIYTSVSFEIMEHTNNEDAAWEMDGTAPHSTCWTELVSNVAYHAYRADLEEKLWNMNEEDVARLFNLIQCEECDFYRNSDEDVCPNCTDNEDKE